MNWEAIGAIGEIVGAVAVVFSLLYLALQMRRNAIETQAMNRNAISEMTSSILMQTVQDKELNALVRKGLAGTEPMDTDETFRFDCVMYSIIESIESTFSHWERGALAKEDWEKYNVILGNYMSQPGGKLFWSRSAKNFTKAFQRYIETGEWDVTYDFSKVTN